MSPRVPPATPKTTSEVLDADVLQWAGKIAKAMNTIGVQHTPYGEFYVEKVVLGYEGETYGTVSIVPDEFGGYGVRIELNVHDDSEEGR